MNTNKKTEINRTKVALLIPTLNAGENWNEALQMISNQNIKIDKKLIIDSGSKDRTVEEAIAFGFDVHRINKNEFNHGKTRQQLVDLADNIDICVFLTQDAILASVDSIANIVGAFINDLDVGIAYGRQLPHKDAKMLESHARLYNYPPDSEFQSFPDRDRLGFKTF